MELVNISLLSNEPTGKMLDRKWSPTDQFMPQYKDDYYSKALVEESFKSTTARGAEGVTDGGAVCREIKPAEPWLSTPS